MRCYQLHQVTDGSIALQAAVCRLRMKIRQAISPPRERTHTLCEFRLKLALGMKCRNPIKTLKWYSEEMEDCATGYVAYIMELVADAKKSCTDPVVLIEQRLDYSKYVESGFGTGDCVIIADGTLHVCDYKNGRGIFVEAERNPQMMLYALGALELFDGIYDIGTVSMTVYQPRRLG